MREIEVTEPMHPLHGKRFPLVNLSSQKEGQGEAIVSYRDGMNLSIPLAATDWGWRRERLATKLTWESVTEFVTLARNDEMICPSHPDKSGTDSTRRSKKASAKKSKASSRK